MVGNYAPKH
jgi:hypothetical protein